jgi:hypothetical protein
MSRIVALNAIMLLCAGSVRIVQTWGYDEKRDFRVSQRASMILQEPASCDSLPVAFSS